MHMQTEPSWGHISLIAPESKKCASSFQCAKNGTTATVSDTVRAAGGWNTCAMSHTEAKDLRSHQNTAMISVKELVGCSSETAAETLQEHTSVLACSETTGSYHSGSHPVRICA